MAMDQENKFPKSSSTPESGQNEPKKSGSVKGPMGVGSPASSSGGRVTKQDPHDRMPEDKREISATPAGGTMEEPAQEPDSASSTSQEPLKLKPSKRDQKTQEKPRELASGDPIELPDRKKEQGPEGKAEKEAPAQQQAPEEEPPARKAAKKMSRRKHVPGISAEEKLKLGNSSPTEQLKDRVKDSTKELFDAVKPQEELQDELAKLLLQLVPSSEHIKSAVPSQDQLTKVVRMVNEKLSEGRDNLDQLLNQIQDVELREQIRAAIRKQRRGTA